MVGGDRLAKTTQGTMEALRACDAVGGIGAPSLSGDEVAHAGARSGGAQPRDTIEALPADGGAVEERTCGGPLLE